MHQLKNDNALNLLYDLEKMDILNVIRENETEKISIGEKFAGVFSKKDSDSLKAHLKNSREELDRFI
ncbi:MAG: hypothetical protein H7174_00655 [Flavobacterium sp.]|nr:hypothetical protein [Flavobacterium sp.]